MLRAETWGVPWQSGGNWQAGQALHILGGIGQAMTIFNAQQAVRAALQLHQQRRLPEAIDAYKQALQADPRNSDALHLLGVAEHQTGESARGAEHIRSALKIQPKFPQAHFNLGIALQALGKLDEAIASFNTAIAQRPNFPGAWNNLGIVLHLSGRLDESVAAYRKAVAQSPDFADAHNNLGNVLQAVGMYDESIDCCREAIRLKPSFPEAYNNLGTALHGCERYDESIECYRAAIHLRPGFAEAYLNLGNAYKSAKRYEESVATLREALQLSPHFPLAWLSLGMALVALESDEAVGCFHRAIQQQPNLAEAHRQLGLAAQAGGRVDEALAYYRKAIEADPTLANAHFNLALLSLLHGDFETGWREYEWRWRVPAFPSPTRKYPQPKWDGSNLAGKTLFIHAEQGLGDTLQFARFLPLVCRRAGRVIFEVQPPLLRLMQANPLGASEVIGRYDLSDLPRHFDAQLPLLSVPAALGMLEPFVDANNFPYLHADESLRTQWRSRLSAVRGYKVGLTWAGNKEHGDDRFRSIPLKKLAPLARNDVSFISLQIGPASVEANEPQAGIPLLDWTDNITDFADTAALIAELDLVICVDTAVAHLAGALGKPVWLLVPFMPDFRWQRNRPDSPWYPLMKLFRQSKRADWTDVIATVSKALEDRVQV